MVSKGFPGGSESKEPICSAGNPGFIPGSGRVPREGNEYPLHYSCLERSIDRGPWQATVHEVTKSLIWLSDEHLLTYLITESKCNGFKVLTYKNSLVRQQTHWLDLGIKSRVYGCRENSLEQHTARGAGDTKVEVMGNHKESRSHRGQRNENHQT